MRFQRACLFVSVLALGACRGESSSGGVGRLPDGRAPSELNLLVVTLDTTRLDRLGCYGSTQVATPNLDRLAASGVLFERAISPVPLTLPAHCSLFTGLLPAAHGVRDNGGFVLAPEHLTLATVLRQRGWSTGGFVAAYVLDHRWGIAQGFDRYYDDFDLTKYKTVSMGDIQRRGDDVVAHALDWVESQGQHKFFAWVHLYDPHAPYDPPEPYKSRYTGHPYNGEIAWTDELVGRLLAGLDRMNLRQRTIIAVVADHGESLGEHGESGHGYFLYEPTTRIPFLLAAPYSNLAGRRVAPVVRSIDVTPTLLELLGQKGALAAQGRSLVPLIADARAGAEPSAVPSDDDGDGYSEAFYARLHYGWAELRAVRTRRWHFIEAPKPELYDTENDPGEEHNLADGERRTVARLRGTLADLDRSTLKSATVTVAKLPVEEDEDTLKKLAALGYVGSLAKPSDKSFRDLPDPKDRLAVYNLINHAREETEDDKPGATGRTIDFLRQALAVDPEVIDAWFLLGNAYARERDWDHAAECYRTTLAKRPDHDYAAVGLADTLVAKGQIDDAVLGYEHFLEHDPNNAQILYRLAQVELDAGHDGPAAKYFQRTLEVEPRTARAEVGLAVVAFRGRNFASAHLAIARAIAIDPTARHAHYNLALILEEEGNLADAEQAYRAELAAHPEAYKASFNLGRLLARRGDQPAALAALAETVTRNPDFGVGHLFYAQALLDSNDLVGAEREARQGLALDPKSDYAPLGHYVLADLLDQTGRASEAAQELRAGKALEARRQD
ncbi:MAG: sulfatase-like hydrolase/transferase [Acidobacteriota bacterium]